MHTINIEFVSKFIQDEGYKILDIQEPWRYIVAKLQKGNKIYFLKFAKETKLAKYLNNQFLYPKFLAKSKVPLNIHIPKSYKYGEYEGYPWAVFEFIDGELLCERKVGCNTTQLESKL